MELRWIQFPTRSDARGLLVPMEAESVVPFAIKRIYALVRLQSEAVRGAHAHHTLRQVIVALAGSCRIVLEDGLRRVETVLNDPSRGLLLEPLIWHEMSGFSSDCVLVVLAAEHYDEGDYIREHAEFLRFCRKEAAT